MQNDPNSVVDYLKSKGQSYDTSSRAKLAQEFGLVSTPEEYSTQSIAPVSPTATHINTKLLQALKDKASKTTTSAVVTPPSSSSCCDSYSNPYSNSYAYARPNSDPNPNPCSNIQQQWQCILSNKSIYFKYKRG